MSVDTISEDANIISRLQLAKALKEDPYAENSAIFLRQRNQPTKYGPPRGSFYIPRPMNLLVPPVLGNAEGLHKDNNLASPSSQPNILSSQQQDRRPSQPQIYTSSPRNSVIIPEERRGSASKPATLMDVRESILEVRQNLQNSIPFSTSSSQRTSIILQQNKSLPDSNGKLHGASKLSNVTNSRPNSVVLSPHLTTNNTNSRPTSFYKSNKSSNDDEEDDETSKSKSKKSKEIKKSGSSSDDDSNSAPKLPPIKSVTNQAIILEKVEEEDDSSDESDDDESDDDDDESSEDDTPLALKSKSTPKIKVAPPKITTRKGSNGGGRIEAWLEHVSGSPEGPLSRSSTPTHSPRSSTPTHSPRPSTPHSPRPSTPTHSPRPSTPTHSPTHAHSPRTRKTSEHSIHQYNSSPLSPHRMSHVAEPIYDARNRRPKSAYIPDNLQVLKPDPNQPRKRSNSEFLPKIRPNSVYEQAPQVPPFPIGRVSPSPRQDSGYWAKDTLIALSDDLRHINLMNDSNSSHSSKSSRRRSASFNNINGVSNNSKLSPANNIAKVINRHRREGSGSSVHSSKAPQIHVQGNYLPQAQIPALQSSRSKDSLSVYLPSTTNGNRNSLYMNNNNIPKKVSSEQLKANRNSTYSLHQQKNRIRS